MSSSKVNIGALICVGAMLSSGTASLHALTIIYVNASAQGENSGTSWKDAFVDLQDALQEIRDSCDYPCEIWVADGTYRPDRGTGDRHATFQMYNNVAMYGGFEGWESDCDQRDPVINETILSGDLSDDDLMEPNGSSNCCMSNPAIGCSDETCREIVIAASELCGFVWHNGCAGLAQLYCCDLCRPSRCENSLHVVTAGSTDSTAILDGFIVRSGEANQSPDVLFGDSGAGILATDLEQHLASPTINRCTFRDNVARRASAFFHVLGEPTVMQSNFVENFNIGLKGCVESFMGDPRFVDCLFSGNKTGALYYAGHRGLERCAFINNPGPFAEALYISSTTCTLRDCVFIGNGGSTGGALEGSFSNIQLINCDFRGNQPQSGATVQNSFGAMVMQNCVFSGNGIANQSSGPSFSNDGNATLLNCTFANNVADDYGAGMINYGSAVVADSIFRGNWSNKNPIDVEGAQITNALGATLQIGYSSVEGWTGSLGGVGNVDLDPSFVDADGVDDVLGTADDNLRLSVESPLIDLGDRDPPLAAYLDADGHARILCGRIDMGAYEFGIGDYDCDRVVELGDFMAFPACMTGPNGGPYTNWCEAFDFHAEIEDRIDLRDFAGLQMSIEGDWP